MPRSASFEAVRIYPSRKKIMKIDLNALHPGRAHTLPVTRADIDGARPLIPEGSSTVQYGSVGGLQTTIASNYTTAHSGGGV